MRDLHTELDATADVTASRRGRHRAGRRFTKFHAGILAGIALIGVGVTAGTASADPTAQDWANIRGCESGGDYSINTGNGYYGAYQFDLGTWRSVGGSGLPSDASPAEQDARALTLWRERGWSPWACSHLVSLSDGTAAPQPVAAPTPAPVVVRRAPVAPFPLISASVARPWTEHLFRTVLSRANGGTSTYATSQIAGQISPAMVAGQISTTRERLNHLVAQAFVQCLGRGPSVGEVATYAPWLKANTLGGLYAALCSGPEASVRAQTVPKWVDRVFVALFTRHATAAEVAKWTNYTVHQGRSATVSALIGFSQWRVNQLNQVYRAMLGRNVDANGVATYAGSMSGRGIFDVVVAIAMSNEFHQKS